MSDVRLLRRLLRAASVSRLRLALAALLELLSVPLTLMTPVPLAIAVDSAIGAEPLPGFVAFAVPASVQGSAHRVLLLACALQVLIVLLVHARGLVATYVQATVGETATVHLRSRLLAHAQKLSFEFHERRGSADSIYRIQYDAAVVHDILFGALLPLVVAVATLGSMLVIIVGLDATIAAVALAVTPILLAATRYYRARIKRRYVELKEVESSVLHIVQEILSALRVVKSFGREQFEQARFDSRSNESARARVSLYLAEGVFTLFVNLVTATGTALVLYIGVTRVRDGSLTVGALLVILSYLAQIYGPLQVITRQMGRLQGKVAGAERVLELLDETPLVRERALAVRVERAAGDFRLTDMTFAYPGGTPVFEGVDLWIPAGTRVGMVGRTGAGKSTFLSLLMRFRDPQSGMIQLDGVDLRNYQLESLRAQFAVVLQDPFLFSTSIGENIAYGRPGASYDDIVAASTAADIHHAIEALPDGYDTRVDERGMRLSGGERQRISLARAFLRDAPILLLDEPTSSVDGETEDSIIEAMNRLMERRTVFMVAHRTSTLRDCDMWLRVGDGTIAVDHVDVRPATARGRGPGELRRPALGRQR